MADASMTFASPEVAALAISLDALFDQRLVGSALMINGLLARFPHSASFAGFLLSMNTRLQ
jgi:hypothetical protein